MTNKGPFSGLEHLKIEADYIYFTTASNKKAQPFLFSEFQKFIEQEFSELCKKNQYSWPSIMADVNRTYFPITLFLQKVAL